jgi:hypothetical protein
MRNRSTRLVWASAIATVTALVQPAWAAEMQPLKVSKECSQYSGEVPSFCTITQSNLDALPAGTKVYYYGPVANNPNFSSNNVVLDDAAGSTAVGNCIVYFAGGPAGMCAFHAGSGKLAGFQGMVKVTVDDKQIWHWDGEYLLAPAAN